MAESIDLVFRDFNTPGVPGSGDYEPEKVRIRRLLREIAGGTSAVGDYRGPWNNATAYVRTDLVEYGGSIWYADLDNTNVTPAENATWTLFLPGATVADGSLGLAKLTTAALADLRMVSPQGPRSAIGYYQTYSVQIVGETSFAMGGFRYKGKHKRSRAAVYPAPAFTPAIGGSRHVIDLGNGTSTQGDLGVETLHSKENWYAPFACANSGDAAASLKVMPFFRVRDVGVGGATTVRLNAAGEGSRSASAKTYTMPVNGLAGVEVLVITETLNGRPNAFSGRVTTIVSNTASTLVLADVGALGPYDYLLPAPPGFTDYRYLGACYMDTGEIRNIADSGTIVHSRGANNTNASISGLIGAGGVDMPCDGYISPLALGVLIEESNALSTTEVGRGYSKWGMDNLHDSVNLSWYKATTAADAVDMTGPIMPFIFSQIANLRASGALNTANNSRQMRMYGWIEP